MKTEVRCPVCNSSFLVGSNNAPIAELTDGIHYLVPETIRNDNVTKTSSVDDRLEALKSAGLNVDKLKNLMNSNEDLKSIFDDNDPILNEIGKGGFIRNNELFRRWITAQTWRLITSPYGWTKAVRGRYRTRYVLRQSINELALLCKLERKGLKGKDKRFDFFTFEDLKAIFVDLNNYNRWANAKEVCFMTKVHNATTYSELLDVVTSMTWSFYSSQTYISVRWLNCFKGAGAFYTLQNIIRTHGMVLPNCKDMDESLKRVDDTFKSIISYEPRHRRWDILLSVLSVAVKEKKFELKY